MDIVYWRNNLDINLIVLPTFGGEQKDLKNCSTFAGLYYEPVLAICDLIKKIRTYLDWRMF